MRVRYEAPDISTIRRARRRRVAWVAGLGLMVPALVAGLALFAMQRTLSNDARDTLESMVSVWGEDPGATTVPTPQRVEPAAEGGEDVAFPDFRFRIPREWRVVRTQDVGTAIWLRHADGTEVAMNYGPQRQAPGDTFNSEILAFMANHLRSADAAEQFLREFPSDLAVFEAAYALTPQRIDVRNATQSQLRRDIPLFAWKTSTRGEHRLNGLGMTAYVGARQQSGRRNGPPGQWLTFINALDERGQFRGTVIAYNYRYPDPPGDALIRELVATARFGQRPSWPATAPATRPATTAATAPVGEQ